MFQTELRTICNYNMCGKVPQNQYYLFMHRKLKLPYVNMMTLGDWRKKKKKNYLHIYFQIVDKYAWLAKGFNAPALDDGFNLPDKQVDPGCCLRFGF